jgi:hypothetical protein
MAGSKRTRRARFGISAAAATIIAAAIGAAALLVTSEGPAASSTGVSVCEGAVIVGSGPVECAANAAEPPSASPSPAPNDGADGSSPAAATARPAEWLKRNGRLDVDLQVERKGELGDWDQEVRGVPGDVVTWRSRIRDGSDRVAYDNVVQRMLLAPHLRVIPGSVRLINSENDWQLADTPAFAGGFDIGDFIPGSVEYVMFDTQLRSDFDGCAVRVRNLAAVGADGQGARITERPGPRWAYADAVVGKTHC